MTPRPHDQNDHFEITGVISPADSAVLERGLADSARSQGARPFAERPLGIFQRDAHGVLTAGLIGKIFWDWLYIDMLWIDPSLRNQGWGTKLMAQAEQEARGCGLRGIYLWTESFEAPGFYQKQGYEIFCHFPDFPEGHQRFGLRKIFSARSR